LRSAFSDDLARLNRLDEAGFDGWLFRRGMLFNESDNWWSGEPRRTPHEGLDFYRYRTIDGEVRNLDDSALIPAAFDGDIVKMESDHLGISIFMRHDIADDAGRRLYTIYGHSKPKYTARHNLEIKAGDVIGTIAAVDTGRRSPPHLHITMAWAPHDIAPDRLSWETIGGDDTIELIDPLDVIECKYAIIENDSTEG